MGANGQRAYEADLDMSVWHFGGQCPTCTGVLAYKYKNMQKPGVELKVFPNKKRFEVFELQFIRNRKRKVVTLQGALDNMKVLLAGI